MDDNITTHGGQVNFYFNGRQVTTQLRTPAAGRHRRQSPLLLKISCTRYTYMLAPLRRHAISAC